MESNKKTGMKFFLIFLVLFTIAIPSTALAAFPVRFEGTVTINGNSSSALVNNATVTAHINNSETAAKTAIVGSHPTGNVTAGWYIAEVPCDSGNNITFRVYGVNASPTNATPQNCTGLWKEVNLSITTLANGVACLYNGGCTTGHCSSDYDGAGSWCAASTSCVHDGTIYTNSGTVCSSTAVLQTCNNGFWNASSCTSGCSAGACLSAAAAGGGGAVNVTNVTNITAAEEKPAAAPITACNPNAKRCDGNNLQVCASDGSAWTTTETCTYGCDSEKLECKAAPPFGITPEISSYIFYVIIIVIVVIAVVYIFMRLL